MHSSHPSPRASGSTLMPVQADKVIEIMLQCMSPEMALNRHGAMSDLSPQCAISRSPEVRL